MFTVFFFNDTATTEIYTLSLHDALPIFDERGIELTDDCGRNVEDSTYVNGDLATTTTDALQLFLNEAGRYPLDRKSTRLNSSHANISYAVFCLKKKKNKTSHG